MGRNIYGGKMKKPNNNVVTFFYYIEVLILILFSYKVSTQQGIHITDAFWSTGWKFAIAGTVLIILLFIIKEILKRMLKVENELNLESLQSDLIRLLNITMDGLCEERIEKGNGLVNISNIKVFHRRKVQSIDVFGYSILDISELRPLKEKTSLDVRYYAVTNKDELAGIVTSYKDAESGTEQIIDTKAYADMSLGDLNESLKAYRCCIPIAINELEKVRNQYAEELFCVYFEQYDKAIASEWRRFKKKLHKDDVIRYWNKLQEEDHIHSFRDKKGYAKEIAFFVLPQVFRSTPQEEIYSAINELFQYVCNVQEVGIECKSENVDILQDTYCIHNMEEGQKYYMENGCSCKKYENGYVETDFSKIIDYYNNFNITQVYQEWNYDAYDILFVQKTMDCEQIIMKAIMYLGMDAYSKNGLEKLYYFIENHKTEIKRKDFLRNFFIIHVYNQGLGNYRYEKKIIGSLRD